MSQKRTARKGTQTKPAPEQAPKAEKNGRLSFEALQARNPGRNLKPETLAFEADGKHANKQTVVLVCPCGAERRVATSDLFQVDACEACVSARRKEARREKRAAKKAAAAALLAS